MSDLVQITLGLMTIAASGITSAIVTFKLASRRELLIVRRKKLELVNESLIGWCDQIGTHWITYQSVMLGKLNYNQALDMQLERKHEPQHAKRLEVLIPLYFPDLSTHLATVRRVIDEGADVLDDYKNLYESTGGDSSHAHASQFPKLIAKLDLVESKFQDHIAAIAKSLNS